MKKTLLGMTILMGLAAPAWATGINDIEIDASTAGSVKTLAIIQDDANLTNQVSATSTPGTQLPVIGPWKTISINQQGGNNLFTGSLAAHSGSTTAGMTAAYSGGNNTQSLTIGATTAPSNPTVSIAVANTGGSTNTIDDTLDGTGLTYNLAVTGTGNSVTNTVLSAGGITLSQGGGGYGITGDNNSVTNTVGSVTPVGSFTHYLTIASSGNTIANTVDGSGNKTITQSISTLGGSTLTMNLSGSGDQTAAMSVDSGSVVNYTLNDAAPTATANIILSNVKGLGGIPAVINVTQTSAATDANANVTIIGTGYTMGTTLTGVAGANTTGVVITQNSANANLNMTTTANAVGYTVHVTQ